MGILSRLRHHIKNREQKEDKKIVISEWLGFPKFDESFTLEMPSYLNVNIVIQCSCGKHNLIKPYEIGITKCSDCGADIAYRR